MFPDKPDYKSDHVILDKTSHSHDLKDFYFSFLELPKFTKNIDELNNRVEKWAYFFKHAEETSEAELARIVESDKVIKQAYEALNRFSWSEIELNTYEAEEKRERDAQAILDQNALEAEAKGEAKGKAEGKAEGLAEGLAKGIAKGEINILVRLLKKKFGIIPEKYLQRIEKADADTLLMWVDEAVDAQTITDIFNKLA
jgi:predicted transposase/invertase (TIGR01784 family)